MQADRRDSDSGFPYIQVKCDIYCLFCPEIFVNLHLETENWLKTKVILTFALLSVKKQNKQNKVMTNEQSRHSRFGESANASPDI